MPAQVVEGDHRHGAVVVGAVEARGRAASAPRVHVDSVIDQISGGGVSTGYTLCLLRFAHVCRLGRLYVLRIVTVRRMQPAFRKLAKRALVC